MRTRTVPRSDAISASMFRADHRDGGDREAVAGRTPSHRWPSVVRRHHGRSRTSTSVHRSRCRHGARGRTWMVEPRGPVCMVAGELMADVRVRSRGSSFVFAMPRRVPAAALRRGSLRSPRLRLARSCPPDGPHREGDPGSGIGPCPRPERGTVLNCLTKASAGECTGGRRGDALGSWRIGHGKSTLPRARHAIREIRSANLEGRPGHARSPASRLPAVTGDGTRRREEWCGPRPAGGVPSRAACKQARHPRSRVPR